MATGSDTEPQGTGIGRKLIVPAAITAGGGALGYLLTKKQNLRAAAPKLRDAAAELPRPHVPDVDVGDLAGDLREKVESVLGKASPAASSRSSTASIDSAEFQQRRRARQERRTRRRQRSRR